MSDIPAGYRWCVSGTCGRLLPVTEFHLVGRGAVRDSRCKTCNRRDSREHKRTLLKSPKWRAVFAARNRAYRARRAQGRAA